MKTLGIQDIRLKPWIFDLANEIAEGCNHDRVIFFIDPPDKLKAITALTGNSSSGSKGKERKMSKKKRNKNKSQGNKAPAPPVFDIQSLNSADSHVRRPAGPPFPAVQGHDFRPIFMGATGRAEPCQQPIFFKSSMPARSVR